MSYKYPIQGKSVPTFYFIGVTTGSSAINKIFPRWMRALHQDEVHLEGIDHPIHATVEAYRKTVAQIKFDPLSMGGLVTTHKIDLLEAVRDMFDELDPMAQLTGEVTSISKRGGKLWGHAKDPLTSGLSLKAFLEEGYFGKTKAQVLCFGAGGSGKAIAYHFITTPRKSDRPAKIVVVNRSQGRLDSLRAMVSSLGTNIEFECIRNSDPLMNDQIMENLPAGSLVINATGMGKDSPGSPVSDAGLFPSDGIAWEINYRGELAFWHQAMAQQSSRNLRVEDGWLYFLHGWTQVIAEVLHVEMTEEKFQQLADIAADFRPTLVGSADSIPLN